MIILELFKNFIALPIIIMYLFFGSVFSIHILTVLLYFIFCWFMYKKHVMLYKPIYRIFYFIFFVCALISMFLVRFMIYEDMMFWSYILSPFEIIATLGIVVGIFTRDRG